MKFKCRQCTLVILWSFTVLTLAYPSNRRYKKDTDVVGEITSLDCAMTKSLAIELVGTGFTSRYHLQPRVGF